MVIGTKAIDFIAPAVMPNNDIKDDFRFLDYVGGSVGILVFYPLDFTFVCPSEILAINSRINEFEKNNAKVVLVSVDSQFTHLAYKKTAVQDGGIGQISVPMVADIDKSISRKYDVLHADSVALRGTFIFDSKNILRHKNINDLPIGRSVDEMLRIVDAIQFHEEHGEVCPANWSKGQEAMTPTQEGVSTYLRNKYSDK